MKDKVWGINGERKEHGSFSSFLAEKTATHLQLTFSDPKGKLLRVGTVSAGIDRMLHAVLYSS